MASSRSSSSSSHGAQDHPGVGEEGDLDRMLAAMDGGLAADAEAPEPLTEARLRMLTGFDDLSKVLEAELTVDAEAGGVDLLGHALTTVTDLRLSNSRIRSCRAFGTRLVHLQRLWLRTSLVHEVNGLQFMHQLRELYLSFNSISEVNPLGGLLNLEVLDLEGNLIADFDEVRSLRHLSELKVLTLEGNPVAVGDGSAAHRHRFRGRTIRALAASTALEALDDTPVSVEERAAAAAQQVDDDDDDDAATPDTKGHTQSRDADDEAASRDRVAELKVLADGLRQRAPGLDALVQDQHRGLLSRQSSSAAGGRRSRAATSEAMRHSTPPSAAGDGLNTSVSRATPPKTRQTSAPANIGSPSKAPQQNAPVVAPRNRPSPPPSAAAPAAGAAAAAAALRRGDSMTLSTSAHVYTGNITRSLRSSKPVGSGAVLQALDSTSGTPLGGGTPATAASGNSFAQVPDAFDMENTVDDVVDETDDAIALRKKAAEADAIVQRSLAEEERVMTARAQSRQERRQQQQEGHDGTAASPPIDDDDEDAADGRIIDKVRADEETPEVAAWRRRMEQHLRESGYAGAENGAVPPTVAGRMSDAEAVKAVKAFKESSARTVRHEMLREAIGGPTDDRRAMGGVGAAAGGPAYESIALHELGKGQKNDGLYDDVL